MSGERRGVSPPVLFDQHRRANAAPLALAWRWGLAGPDSGAEGTAMSESTSYDELPYDSKPVATTHPDNLAALATLRHLKPPPPGARAARLSGCVVATGLSS